MRMKQAVIYVECCGECPFFDNETEDAKCMNLDKQVEADEIDEKCPLDDM